MAYGFKTGGRQLGTPNKNVSVKKERKNRAEHILALIETDYLKSDIEQLTPHQRTQLFRDLMEYAQPKLSRSIVTDEEGNTVEVKQVFMIGNVEVVLEGGSNTQLPG
jgi:hypothetical protein